jgi:hypothetical protein
MKAQEHHGDLIDVKSIMEEWEQTTREREFVPGVRVTGRIYHAVPEPIPLMLRVLVTAASQAESLEDAKLWLAKAMEFLEWMQLVGECRPTTGEEISEGIVLVPHEGKKTVIRTA